MRQQVVEGRSATKSFLPMLQDSHTDRTGREKARSVRAWIGTLSMIGLLASTSLCSREILVENVTIITPDQPAPLWSRHVLIREERIANISAQPIPADRRVERIDGRNKFLTPGLMDSHVHVSHPPGLPLGSAEPSHQTLQQEFAAQQPRSYLYFGVTQLLDLASFQQAVTEFQSQPLHPDLFTCAAAPALNGYPSNFIPEATRYALMPDYIYEPANAQKHPLPHGAIAADHTPQAVADRIAVSGARCVKVFIESGFGDATGWPVLSADSLKALRAATRQRGLLLLAHANALASQQAAVAAEVDVIAHGLWNWNGAASGEQLPKVISDHLRDIHTKKIGYQPTIRVLAGMADLFRHDTLRDPMYKKVVPAELLSWYSSDAGQWFKEQLRVDFGGASDVQIAHVHLKSAAQGMRAAKYLDSLGHPLLLASDTPSAPTYGNQPGYDTYREMRFMAQSNISLAAILHAATINNARQFKLDKDYGTVSVGKIANLLLLDANPLETIRAWSLIDKVILRGKVIERETLAADR
jgi:imidazolonepropionase-like amidohydrolase